MAFQINLQVARGNTFSLGSHKTKFYAMGYLTYFKWSWKIGKNNPIICFSKHYSSLGRNANFFSYTITSYGPFCLHIFLYQESWLQKGPYHIMVWKQKWNFPSKVGIDFESQGYGIYFYCVFSYLKSHSDVQNCVVKP